MNYWILQDKQQEKTLAERLSGDGNPSWSINSSYLQLKANDWVLLWQAHADDNVRGVHAWGRVAADPVFDPDPDGRYKVSLTDIHVLTPILSAKEIESSLETQLLSISILQTGAQRSRRVHRLTPEEWAAFQRLRPEIPELIDVTHPVLIKKNQAGKSLPIWSIVLSGIAAIAVPSVGKWAFRKYRQRRNRRQKL